MQIRLDILSYTDTKKLKINPKSIMSNEIEKI